jgi:glycosyltransferase involved in cell wall biosynthesis
VREGLAAAGLLVAPTRAFLDDFRDAWGRLPPARVVPNGLDLTPPNVPKRPFVLAAGRLWDEAKGVATLAEAVRHLPWPVLVAGDGGPAGEGVRHLGRLQPAELRALMAEAAVFAAPARYEPFGLAVLEAAASGCALVLGDIPTLRELWGGGGAARFVSQNEPGGGALAAALLDLAGDGAGRERLGAAARERARALTRGRMVEGYLAAYADLPARAPREGRAA